MTQTQYCYLCGNLAVRIPLQGPLICERCKRKVKQAKKKQALAVASLDKIAGVKRERQT